MLLLAHAKIITLADVHDLFCFLIDVAISTRGIWNAAVATVDYIGLLHSAGEEGAMNRRTAG
jgi:hypothetical protein